VTTYNAYVNDYGALNEAMSDAQGMICKRMYAEAEGEEASWELGDKSAARAIRSMSDPQRYNQPAYVWDVHYVANVKTPTEVNDEGGVHTNSSLMNSICYRLIEEGGMTNEEGRAFWFAVDASMVPKTDYPQLSELLPVVLRNVGLSKYEEALASAIDFTRIRNTDLPESFGENRAFVTLTLPDTEAMTDGNWSLGIQTLNVDKLVEKLKTYGAMVSAQDYSFLPQIVQDFL
jgi:hypothetical protein